MVSNAFDGVDSGALKSQEVWREEFKALADKWCGVLLHVKCGTARDITLPPGLEHGIVEEIKVDGIVLPVEKAICSGKAYSRNVGILNQTMSDDGEYSLVLINAAEVKEAGLEDKVNMSARVYNMSICYDDSGNNRCEFMECPDYNEHDL